MNIFKTSVLLVVVLFIATITLNRIHLPSQSRYKDIEFSASNVQKHINILSTEPRSIHHPIAREKVRQYLGKELEANGFEVNYIYYDSVKDRFGQYMNIGNVYAVSDPKERKPESYILLMAHLDSRFAKRVKGEEVISLGAADDGYGLGSILEIVRIMSAKRESWRQGVKVLFTDSEESDLEGIRYALKRDGHIFENIGFIINLEARGVKGPALMFETSPNNERIIELYKKGRQPFSYSLTSSIYNILPNYTDFSLIKEDFAGINMSVIDNLNYYHTNLDNPENISLKSIQHYGVQLEPIVYEYLSNPIYTNPEYLSEGRSSYFFSLPFLGLFVINKTLYLIMSIGFLCVFLFTTYLFRKQNRLSYNNLIKFTTIIFLFLVLMSAMAYGAARLSAYLNNLEYSAVNLAYVKYEYWIIGLCIILSSISFTYLYIKLSGKKSRYRTTFLASGILFGIVVSIASHLFTGDSLLISLPTFMAIFAYFLRLFNTNGYIRIIIPALSLLFLIPIIYLLIVALTIGALFIILPLILLFLWTLVPICDAILRDNI